MNDWTAHLPRRRHPACSARAAWRAPRGVDVAVFRNAEDQVFALLDRCPHKGGPLSQGIVFGTSVACPLHNWTIGLDDGCAKAPDEGCTPRFAVQGRRTASCTSMPTNSRRHATDLRAARRRTGAEAQPPAHDHDATHAPPAPTAASAAA